MTNFWNFLKKNWLLILLSAVIIAFAVNYINSREQTTSKAPTELILSQPGQAAATPLGSVVYCLQLDGRADGHLPALMGMAATDAYPNGVSGFNWALPPTSTGAEPYGVLTDGTVFAKVVFLKTWGMVSTVAVKADFTGWQPVTMTLDKVNGEDAYVLRR